MNAYVDGLRMLARRELSEAQIRQRLARREHTAEAIARTQSSFKRRGKLRIRRQIEQAGIAPATARTVVDEVFESVDQDAQLQASLATRLRGRGRIADEREFARLYRYLIGQGFEVDTVLRALRARR